MRAACCAWFVNVSKISLNGEKMQEILRVLHCPGDVGGNAGTLARFEREGGVASWSIALTAAGLGMPIDEVATKPGSGRAGLEFARWKLLYQAVRKYDVIHFNFGRTLMPLDHHLEDKLLRLSLPRAFCTRAYAHLVWFRDIKFFKSLGKVIFVTYQGDDARQGDFCKNNFEFSPAEYDVSGTYSRLSDESKRKAINVFAKLADKIYFLNPDLGHVLPERARFLPYTNLDPDEWIPNFTSGHPQPVVVHAPTSRSAKGTSFILSAVEQLKAEGVPFEFRLIENMTRQEARLEYERADLLIDQLLVGWYGGLAVELMALGKPVICHIRDNDLKYIPAKMRQELPVIDASPNNIVETLRYHLTTGKGNLAALGLRSRKYVEDWHNPRMISKEVISDYYEAIGRK